MKNWQVKVMNFMRGRYGQFDALNKMLLVVSLILFLIPVRLLSWLAYVLLIVMYYRIFSKRIYVRSNENQKYVALQNKIVGRFNYRKEAFQNRKHYVYFRCPECKQQLRAPKGKGKIKVTCNQCQHQFVKQV